MLCVTYYTEYRFVLCFAPLLWSIWVSRYIWCFYYQIGCFWMTYRIFILYVVFKMPTNVMILYKKCWFKYLLAENFHGNQNWCFLSVSNWNFQWSLFKSFELFTIKRCKTTWNFGEQILNNNRLNCLLSSIRREDKWCTWQSFIEI